MSQLTPESVVSNEPPPPRLYHSSRKMHQDFRARLKRGEDFKDEDDEDKFDGDPKVYFRDYLRFMKPFRGAIIVLMCMALMCFACLDAIAKTLTL